MPDAPSSPEGSSDDESGESAPGSLLDWLLGGPTRADRPGPDPPDRPGPSVEVPAVDETPTTADVPAGLQVRFWTLVLVVKVGLLAVALGGMLAGFRGDWRGGVLAVGGAALVVRAFQRARAYEGSASEDG